MTARLIVLQINFGGLKKLNLIRESCFANGMETGRQIQWLLKVFSSSAIKDLFDLSYSLCLKLLTLLMGPEDQSTGYFLPLEDVLRRKQGMIQCIIRAVLFNQLKREFGWDLLSSLGLQDIRFWVRDFAYHIPSEEAAVGTKSGSSLYLSCRVTFVFIHLSASVPFRRIAAQPFLPR